MQVSLDFAIYFPIRFTFMQVLHLLVQLFLYSTPIILFLSIMFNYVIYYSKVFLVETITNPLDSNRKYILINTYGTNNIVIFGNEELNISKL
jgi:hypothetical protein